MGIYCYGLLVKPHTAKLEDGTEIQVHLLNFMFNGGSFYGPSNIQNAMVARTEKTWEGRKLPEYVMRSGEGKPALHHSVYKFTGDGPLWVDCDKFPGELIGYVNEIVRGVLHVGPCRHEARDPKTTFPPFDLETGRDICTNCGELFGPENVARAKAYVAELDRRRAEEEAAQEATEKTYREARARGDAFLGKFRATVTFKVNVLVETHGWCHSDFRFPAEEMANAYAKELMKNPGVLEVRTAHA
jgi:hypothetical protein